MSCIYLCGHTGSINRGCEAILRSTNAILHEVGVKNVNAMTFDIKYDDSLGLSKELVLIPYPIKPLFLKGVSYLKRKVFKDGVWGSRFLYRDLFEHIESGDMVFNVGGDTYCYDTPYISYALNEMAKMHGIPSVFWGCSVDNKAISDETMRKDIDSYSFIVARESMSYEILKKCVKDASKVQLACDPAFRLIPKKIVLPDKFFEGNTLGLNLSPLVFSDVTNIDDIMYQNAKCLIEYILSYTDMNVCLIPHVYNIAESSQDIGILQKLYSLFSDMQKQRISIVNREYSCTELKYIISKCRFFIGARTHAMIAAYSSAVPGLALSYSIKSRGIAKDLFGTDEGYAVIWKNIKKPNDLKSIFIETLVKKEEEIRDRYDTILPEYESSILDAAKNILNQE